MPTLKDRKRILNKDGTPAKVVQKLDQSPVFRQNGYNLKFDAVNEDYLELDNSGIWATLGDIDLYLDFTIKDTVDLAPFFSRSISSTDRIEFIAGVNGILYVRIFSSGVQLASSTLSGVIVGNQKQNIELKNSKLYLDGVEVADYTANSSSILSSGSENIVMGSRSYQNNFQNVRYYSLTVNNEDFNFSESYGTTITGSNGTVGTINTSSAQSENYTNTEIWQKNSFALVGDGVNQKIVSPLGGETILTSTPLEGGFTLDGKKYNLTEGLGNKIKSEDKTTDCDIVGFTGNTLNFGGWQSGNSNDGWQPYTVI